MNRTVSNKSSGIGPFVQFGGRAESSITLIASTGTPLTAVTEQNAICSDERRVPVSLDPNQAWIFDADGKHVV